MHPNAELIHAFYSAFAAGDAETMANSYAADATFSDPAFPDLKGPEVGGMWRMLLGRAKDLEISFDGVEADDARGRARWEAHYTFSTGRKVHNIIEARFEFAEGRILRHVDSFDFWRWSRQALGLPGLLLGWTSMLQKKVQGEAKKGLLKFLAQG